MGRRFAILIPVLFAAAWLPTAFAQDRAEMTKARDDALAAYDVQRDLPGYVVVEQDQIDVIEAQDEDGDKSNEGAFLDFLKSLALPLQMLFLLALVILVFYALYGLYRNKEAVRAAFRQKRIEPEEAIHVENIQVEQAKTRLQDAKALAAKGQYEHAVHLLLLHSIDDMKRFDKRHVPLSWTTREVLEKVGLPAKAITAMETIAAVVERSFFGDHLIGREGYELCIGEYEHFIASLEEAVA